MQISDQKFTDYVKIVEDRILAVATLQPKLPLSVMVHTIVKEVYAVTEYTRFGTVILFEDNAELRWHHIDLLQSGKILATNSLKLVETKTWSDTVKESAGLEKKVPEKSEAELPKAIVPAPTAPIKPKEKSCELKREHRKNDQLTSDMQKCLAYLKKFRSASGVEIAKATQIPKASVLKALTALAENKEVLRIGVCEWALATSRLLAAADKHRFWVTMTDEERFAFVNSLASLNPEFREETIFKAHISEITVTSFAFCNVEHCEKFLMSRKDNSVYAAAAYRFFEKRAKTGISDKFYMKIAQAYGTRTAKTAEQYSWENLIMYYFKNEHPTSTCSSTELVKALMFCSAPILYATFKTWKSQEAKPVLRPYDTHRKIFVLELVASK